MKNLLVACALVLCAAPVMAQNDTISALREVIVIGQKKDMNLSQAKPLATLDEFLDLGNVGMVRRGSYAWEPLINGMSTERTLITIEGMHIFGACTDKMDPVTSYVEVSNLTEANFASGQQGSGFGATIGGGLDLRRNRTGFLDKGWKVIANSGFESNGSQVIAGGAVNYSTGRFLSILTSCFATRATTAQAMEGKLPFRSSKRPMHR